MVQQMYQRKIYKVNSGAIIKAKMDLVLPYSIAVKNRQVITLADSQVLRWIDELGNFDRDKKKNEYDTAINEIKKIKKEKSSAKNKRRIKELYKKIDDMQFVPEYLTVIMDKPEHIDKLDNGFKINGLTYKRLVGTPNGVKKSTVVYTTIRCELNRRMENYRDMSVPLVPAKFEAYKALCCSASTPVTNTHRVLVVDDLETSFVEDYIELRDGENGGEPIMEYKSGELKLNATDGCGMMTPALAEQWSKDLGLTYTMSGCCIRNSFCKGMLAAFDFIEYNERYGKSPIVKDVWGHEHDIREIDIILTSSMLKLWNCYKSIKDYFYCCDQNGYTFSVTKATPEKADEYRTLNYQFIQSYELTDEQIWELISPTVNEIKDILGGDINKTILYLRGINVTEKNLDLAVNDYVKALMIDERLINDSYVLDKINGLIAKKIKDAKIGVIKVQGNYTIVVGDPVALCQKIFECDVPQEELGLLKAGEIYAKHWHDRDVNEVCCLRAPMSCMNNIRKQSVAWNDDIAYWYRYMPNLIVFNCHDSTCHALSGCDFDSDMVFTTNNKVMTENFRQTPVIVCVQKTAEKKILDDPIKTDRILLESNKLGFGDDIGQVTNRITSMFDILCNFEPGSKEYNILTYRIICGQKFAQDSIDKVKGIIAYGMPKHWYKKIDNPKTEEDEFNNSICADKKPRFMSYIYPDLMKECKEFNQTQKQGMRRIRDNNEREIYYDIKKPINNNNCVLNRLCCMIEDYFKDYKNIVAYKDFDYSILKSNHGYSNSTYNEVYKIYKSYIKEKTMAKKLSNEKRRSVDEYTNELCLIKETFIKKCYEICSNEEELCDIVIDICYSTKNSKAFAWDICGEQIIRNLLNKNNNYVQYITRDDNGDIEYQGYIFSKKLIKDYM